MRRAISPVRVLWSHMVPSMNCTPLSRHAWMAFSMPLHEGLFGGRVCFFRAFMIHSLRRALGRGM